MSMAEDGDVSRGCRSWIEGDVAVWVCWRGAVDSCHRGEYVVVQLSGLDHLRLTRIGAGTRP